jgi:glycogen operon protein
MGGYQIGNHPAGMAEWNGKYRDDLRRYWKGDAGLRPALAARLQGSAEMFDHHRRRPWASVNFITAHDGFTLEDLVSYNEKHNEANGEDGKDGGNDNESCNWGVEGQTDNVDILTQREKIKRDFLASMLFSHGTPMLLAGDEFGHTQNGNNNVYCHDDPLSWIDWAAPFSERGKALRDFTVRLLKLRREHPVLQGRYFQHAQIEFAPGLRDVFWFDERGSELKPEDWSNPNGRLLGLRRVAQMPDGSLDVVITLLSADGSEHAFEIPAPAAAWHVLIDTFDPAIDDVPLKEQKYLLRGHSVALIAARIRPEEVLPPAPQAEAAAAAEAAEPETTAQDSAETEVEAA